LRFPDVATSTTVIYTLSLHDALPIFFGVDITTAFAYGQFNLQVNGIFHVEDDQVRIQHGKVARKLGDITGGQLVLTVDQDEYLRSEEHTSELQSRENLVCRLLLEKKK